MPHPAPQSPCAVRARRRAKRVWAYKGLPAVGWGIRGIGY